MSDNQACPVCGEALRGKVRVAAPDGAETMVYSCGGRCGRFSVDEEGQALLAELSRFSKRRLASLLRMHARRSEEPLQLTAELIRGDAED